MDGEARVGECQAGEGQGEESDAGCGTARRSPSAIPIQTIAAASAAQTTVTR